MRAQNKVVPSNEIPASARPRGDSMYSDLSGRQHWGVEDTPATRGCCRQLAACLGLSATTAPWWAESMLPGDNCVMMTRDGCCAKAANPNNIHGAKRHAERRAERHARLTQIGHKVEVLVAVQRRWYVGTVVNSDSRVSGGGGTTKFVTVKFSNGSVLHNVRSNELRPVPRMTWVHWTYLTSYVLLSVLCWIPLWLSSAHSLRVGLRGGVWLFPDKAFTQMPNTTLYNLTYGEVAAADAHPETWLAAILSTKVEEYRDLSIYGWFRESEHHLVQQLYFLSALYGFAVTPYYYYLRAYPLSVNVVYLLTTVLLSYYRIHNDVVLNQWSSTYPSYTREQIIQQAERSAARDAFGYFCVYFFLNVFAVPVWSSVLRRTGGLRYFVDGKWLAYFLAAVVLWIVMILRVVYFLFLLQDVLDRDDTLERVASGMIYLETTKQYADRALFLWLPALTITTYLHYKLRSFEWYNYVTLTVRFILVVPLGVWYYAVAQPFPFLEPVNWMLVHTRLSHEVVLSKTQYFLLVNYGGFIVLVFEIVFDWIYDGISIACRVNSLNVRTRKALRAWSQSLTRKKDLELQTQPREMMSQPVRSLKGPDSSRFGTEAKLATRTVGFVNPSDYQPLQKRAPTKDVLRPIADHFESYLARPGARLRQGTRGPRCFSPFSAPMQVRHVFRVMGTMIAGYVAHVVDGAGPAQRKAMRETLVGLLDDLECTEVDRQCMLDVADQHQALSVSSSINKLREVMRRLGTKHRDKIYVKCMEGVGHETGFQQLVVTADRVQRLAVAGHGGQVRQTVVSAAMPWPTRVVRLLDSACGVDDRYHKFVSTLATKSGGDYMQAPLKGLFRISEKLWLRPTTNPDPQKPFFPRGDCANVCDVVRGMIVCSSMDVMNICLGLLASCDVKVWRGLPLGHDGVTSAQAAGIKEELNIFRLKNRFKRPTSSGWADIMINFAFAWDPDQHICELQLVHKSMFTARKHCNAHAAYAKFRAALELLETFELATDAGVETVARCDGEKDVEDHRQFVDSQEQDYKDFLNRYQRTMGIDLSKSNTNEDDTDPTGIESSSTCEELLRELKTIQKRRQEDDKKYQQLQKRRQEDDKKYQQIQLQLEKLLNDTKK